MAGFVVARRFRGNLQRERIFRDRPNPLEIYDDVELHSKFRFRRIHILSIVDEVRDAIEYPVTRQGSLSPGIDAVASTHCPPILCDWLLPEFGRGNDRGRQVDSL